MFKAIEAFSKRLDSLGTNMERKLDLVNVNVMNMSERTIALEVKGMHFYIDFQLGLYCFCFNAVCDWSMKETWASLSNKEMQNEKQLRLNDEHFPYLWLFTLSHQSSLVTSFSYTVTPVLGGQPRRMAECPQCATICLCTTYECNQPFNFFLSRLSTDNQDSMFKATEALSKRFDSLGKNIERKLDLVNVNVMNMSGRTTALEMKGMHIYIDFQLGLYSFCFYAVCD